jgi:hypothetical protein
VSGATTTKRPADHVADLLGELNAGHELETLSKKPIEEIDAELRAHGVEPNEVDAMFEKLLGPLVEPAAPAAPVASSAGSTAVPAAAPSNVVSLDARRKARGAPPSLGFLAAAAAVLVLVGGGGKTVIDGLHPDLTVHIEKLQAYPHPADPIKQAKVWRKEAEKRCVQHEWEECGQYLKAAQDLDPAGDKTQDVQKIWDWQKKGLFDQLNPAGNAKQ